MVADVLKVHVSSNVIWYCIKQSTVRHVCARVCLAQYWANTIGSIADCIDGDSICIQFHNGKQTFFSQTTRTASLCQDHTCAL